MTLVSKPRRPDAAIHKDDPVINLTADDQPTTCVHCGTRTMPGGVEDTDEAVAEQCPGCGQRYLVDIVGVEEEETDDLVPSNFEPSEMTLKEEREMELIKSSPYKEFGTY